MLPEPALRVPVTFGLARQFVRVSLAVVAGGCRRLQRPTAVP